MTELKYAKNILTEDLMPPQSPEYIKLMEEQKKAGKTIDRTLLMGIQDSIVKGSFFSGCEWLWELTGDGPVSIEFTHTHDFDEIIGFAGSNRGSMSLDAASLNQSSIPMSLFARNGTAKSSTCTSARPSLCPDGS